MPAELSSLEQIRSTLLDLAVRFGPKLFTAILILVAGGIVSRWMARWLMRLLRRVELEPPVRSLLVRTGRLLVFVLFVVLALQNLGVELVPLIAGLGVVGAGIALATQGVLSNAAAGLSIIFTKPYRVGEYISIANEEGEVDSITLFDTTLAHPDRSKVVIPNRKISGEILHNFGRLRQLDVVVGVAYDTDFSTAFATIAEILQQNPRVLRDPAPVVRIVQLADSAVSIGIRPWVAVADYNAVSGELYRSVAELFRDRGIEIPVPQREVRVLEDRAFASHQASPSRTYERR
jgi:small conductance mechanosensitive channel